MRARTDWEGDAGCAGCRKWPRTKQYHNFDDAFIYEQLARPAEARAISERLLRPEAVEVWKEYEARTDKIDY